MLYLTNENQASLDVFKRFDTNSWDELRQKISYKLVNKKVFHASSDAEDMVYEDYMDLSKVYIVTELSQDREKVNSYMLKKEDIEKFGKTLDDVKIQSNVNYKYDTMKRIRTFKEDLLSHETMYPIMNNINDIMMGGANALIKDSETDRDNILIITNKYNVYGASYMADRTTLRNVYRRMRGDFYILPLSVHQIMCISKKYITSNKDKSEAEDDLLDMLFEINTENKNTDSILSYKIYEYMHDEGERLFAIKQHL